jgi:hypothetical protein
VKILWQYPHGDLTEVVVGSEHSQTNPIGLEKANSTCPRGLAASGEQGTGIQQCRMIDSLFPRIHQEIQYGVDLSTPLLAGCQRNNLRIVEEDAIMFTDTVTMPPSRVVVVRPSVSSLEANDKKERRGRGGSSQSGASSRTGEEETVSAELGRRRW